MIKKNRVLTRNLKEELKETNQIVSKLNSRLMSLIEYKDEFPNEIFQAEINKSLLIIELKVLIQRLKTLGEKQSKQCSQGFLGPEKLK